jgi:hypothetical protein
VEGITFFVGSARLEICPRGLALARRTDSVSVPVARPASSICQTNCRKNCSCLPSFDYFQTNRISEQITCPPALATADGHARLAGRTRQERAPEISPSQISEFSKNSEISWKERDDLHYWDPTLPLEILHSYQLP